MIPSSGGHTNVTNNSPDQTSTDGTRMRVIVAAVVVTALILMLIATVAVIAIVLRLKRGSKQGISNPAYGKWQ